MSIYNTSRSINLKTAKHLAEIAIEEASNIGISISVAIVDSAGETILFEKMDGAPRISIDASMKKARTAQSMNISTGQDWLEFVGEDEILKRGVPLLDEFSFLGGGSPIMHENFSLGAIGVSGGHYKQDEACVQKALAVLEKSI